jgi:uncharacterized protein
MKALLLLGVIFVVAWIWRASRSAKNADSKTTVKARPAPTSIEMVACLHCGVHVASGDAVISKRGAYCSATHRAAAEP